MLLSSLFLGFGLGDPETQIDEGLLLNIGRQRGKETAQCLRRGGRICPMLAGAAIVADLLSADDDLITLGLDGDSIIEAFYDPDEDEIVIRVLDEDELDGEFNDPPCNGCPLFCQEHGICLAKTILE